MPPKNRIIRPIDLPPPILRGGSGTSVASNSTDDVVPPVQTAYAAPENLALATGTAYSSAAPTAYINATWDAPLGAQPPDYYQIQISTSSSFTASGTILATALVDSAHIEGLLPGTLYYVRVRAWARGLPGDWCTAASITTATDTTAASAPTSPAAAWVGFGDLSITWVNPTEANFKDNKIVVRASSGGTIYRTLYSAAQHVIYTYAMNLADTAGAGDSSLYVELQSRTFSNVLSSTVNTGLVTKAVPATPTGLAQSWSGDTGTAGADLTISWTGQNDAYYFNLTLDGTARRVWGTSYTYTLATSRAEHSGTPDPVVSYSLTAADGFHQASTAVSGTATNAAPPQPTVSLTQGFSFIVATVGGTQAGDFAAYEYVWKRDGTTARTLESAAAEQQYELSGASDGGYHSWTVVVRQKDAFAQYSTTVTSSAVAFDALTLGSLRARISYSDSISTAAATLKTAMADDVRDSGGVSYAA